MYKFIKEGNYIKILSNENRVLEIKAKDVLLLTDLFSLGDRYYVRVELKYGLKDFIKKLEKDCIEETEEFEKCDDYILLKLKYRYKKFETKFANCISSDLKCGKKFNIKFEICGISWIGQLGNRRQVLCYKLNEIELI